MWEGELGRAWAVDGVWMHLPTRPRRYCNPALLVLENIQLKIQEIHMEEDGPKGKWEGVARP